MTGLVLYDYFRSSASFRVRIALEMKGLTYETVPTSLLTGDQRSEQYLAMNPQGLVPTLVADGQTLTQSFAIIDWLDRAYPEPRLIPDEPLRRAQALAQTMTIAMDIHPLNNLRVLKYLQRDLDINDRGKNRWYGRWITEGFTALEAGAGDGPFLGGDAPDIADVHLVPQMYNARRFDVDLEPFPRLVAMDAACRALPAFERASPDAAPA